MPKVNIVSYILLKKYEFKQIRPLETHTFSDIIGALDNFFRQIKSFIRFRLAFVFGLQTYYLIDFSKIY